MPKVEWTFRINGTSENWMKDAWGLRFNPYPQHGTYKLNGPDLALQSLAEEKMNPEEIRKRLRPHFTEEFIEAVVARYKPGKMVECHVTCVWK